MDQALQTSGRRQGFTFALSLDWNKLDLTTEKLQSDKYPAWILPVVLGMPGLLLTRLSDQMRQSSLNRQCSFWCKELELQRRRRT